LSITQISTWRNTQF